MLNDLELFYFFFCFAWIYPKENAIVAAVGPFIRVAVQLGSRARALLRELSLYQGCLGWGSSGLITVFGLGFLFS